MASTKEIESIVQKIKDKKDSIFFHVFRGFLLDNGWYLYCKHDNRPLMLYVSLYRVTAVDLIFVICSYDTCQITAINLILSFDFLTSVNLSHVTIVCPCLRFDICLFMHDSRRQSYFCLDTCPFLKGNRHRSCFRLNTCLSGSGNRHQSYIKSGVSFLIDSFDDLVFAYR